MLAQLYEYIKITELYTLNGQIVLCELSINKVINIYEENIRQYYRWHTNMKKSIKETDVAHTSLGNTGLDQ